MRHAERSRLPLPAWRRDAPPPVRPCPNCGVPVDDRFCPRCGQANRERLVSLRAIVRDAVEDQLSLGGALPRTLGALLFRPGRLTRDYAEGRIARSLGFLLATVVAVAAEGWVAWVLGAWLLVYLLLALRRVYAQPWPWTALRYLVLPACYFVVGLVLVAGVLVAAVLTT